MNKDGAPLIPFPRPLPLFVNDVTNQSPSEKNK